MLGRRKSKKNASKTLKKKKKLNKKICIKKKIDETHEKLHIKSSST